MSGTFTPKSDGGTPRVSVVIAAYNAEATLERAVTSVAAQTVPVEITVVDDASEDRTAALAERLCDRFPAVRLLRQPRNCGPAAARNRAIADGSAPWIAVLDSDDHMALDRLERLLTQAEAGGYDLMADDIYKVREEAPFATDRRLWRKEDFGTLDVSLADFITGNLHGSRGQRGELGFVKPLMRRAFLEARGLGYAEDLRLAEDYVLYAEALIAGGRFGLTDPCGYFAVHRINSLSARHTTRDLEALVWADRQLMAQPGLNADAVSALRSHCRKTHKEWAWRRMIDAVRARDLRGAARLWREPPHVLLSLAAKLAQQARLRTVRKIRPSPGGR